MSEKKRALSLNKSSGAMGCFGTIFAFVFCSMFFIAGATVTWITSIGPTIKIIQAGSWKQTPCTILSSEVEDNDESYSVAISFSYEYQGQPYTSDRYDFVDIGTGGRTSKERIVAKYKEGTEQVCFVDPANPAEAVLSRGFNHKMWWGLFGVPFMLVGLVGYYALFFVFGDSSAKDTKSETVNQASTLATDFEPMTPSRTATRTEWGDSDYDEEDLFEEPGPIKLESDSHPLAAFGCLLIFGLIWNGIVSIFVFERLDRWIRLDFEGMEDLFLLPFLLVGIGVIIGAIYSLMASFNPRPVMTLSRQFIPLGGSGRLQWEFESGIGSLNRLKITLVGVEEATYRRGTDTYTDKEQFHEETIVDTQRQIEIARGEVDIPIPTDTMHTFESGNNSIVWRIQLHGDIPLWPDINAKFPIRVVPHE